MNRTSALWLTVALAACAADRSEIDGGDYEAYEAHGHDPADEMLVLATTLSVDRSAKTAAR